jgi:hypothetical protein
MSDFILGERGANLVVISLGSSLAHIIDPVGDDLGEDWAVLVCGRRAAVTVTVTLGSGGVCRACAKGALARGLPMTVAYREWLASELEL